MYHGQPRASDLLICNKEKTGSNRKRKREKSHRPVASQESVIKFTDRTVYPEYRNLIPVWFWSNYCKALEWQNIHRLGLKESYGSAPEHDNMVAESYKLVDPCSDSRNNQSKRKVFDKRLKGNRSCNYHSGKQAWENDFTDSTCDEEFEFEMSEEMIKFFQQSIKHKLEMKKLKAEHSKSVISEVKELHKAHEERERQMKLLYGEGSCMIIGMETAIELSYDKYCDVKSPKFWPNIPLNL